MTFQVGWGGPKCDAQKINEMIYHYARVDAVAEWWWN